MKAHNFVEEEVFRAIDDLIRKRPETCDCEKCKMDIAAIALNNLKPKYVVTEKGGLYTKIDEMEAQTMVDVIKEVTKAINIVTSKPRHDL